MSPSSSSSRAADVDQYLQEESGETEETDGTGARDLVGCALEDGGCGRWLDSDNGSDGADGSRGSGCGAGF